MCYLATCREYLAKKSPLGVCDLQGGDDQCGYTASIFSKLEEQDSTRGFFGRFDDWSNVTKEQFVSRCQDAGIIYATASLLPQLSGASGEQSLQPGSQKPIAIEDGRISLLVPQSLIPDGLGRLTVIVMDAGGQLHATFTCLPTLDYVDGHWYWDKALLDLFGRNMDRMEVCAALETTARTDFSTPEVREFVAELPPSEQKRLAELYLQTHTEEL